jgi:hypothetical protein
MLSVFHLLDVFGRSDVRLAGLARGPPISIPAGNQVWAEE